MVFDTPQARRTLAIVGGGFSGALLALKLNRTRPDWRVVVVEASSRPGRGLAYGACAPSHLLNVPVARMQTGLSPAYGDWLAGRPEMAEALAESGGEMSAAFSPRVLWGQYLQLLVAAARVLPLRGTGCTPRPRSGGPSPTGLLYTKPSPRDKVDYRVCRRGR